MNEFDLNWLCYAVEEVLSVKKESESSECCSDGEQDPSVWKWCKLEQHNGCAYGACAIEIELCDSIQSIRSWEIGEAEVLQEC